MIPKNPEMLNIESPDQDPSLWFADRTVDVTLYRINRRDIKPGEPSIFPRHSEDLLEHVSQVLEQAGSVSSRRGGRKWYIGNFKMLNEDEPILTARLGGESVEMRNQPEFNHETREWEDKHVQIKESFATPIVILGESRLVGIAAPPGVDPQNIARVLAKTLNDGEKKFEIPVTEWHVDPIMNAVGFWDWVETASQVFEITSVFSRPNPHNAEAWEEAMKRLDALEASKISETIKARDKEAGLNKSELRADADLNSMIDAAKNSWANITAKGQIDGHEVTYKQSLSVASEKIRDASATWQVFVTGVIQATLRGRRKMQ